MGYARMMLTTGAKTGFMDSLYCRSLLPPQLPLRAFLSQGYLRIAPRRSLRGHEEEEGRSHLQLQGR